MNQRELARTAVSGSDSKPLILRTSLFVVSVGPPKQVGPRVGSLSVIRSNTRHRLSRSGMGILLRMRLLLSVSIEVLPLIPINMPGKNSSPNALEPIIVNGSPVEIKPLLRDFLSMS